MANHGLDQFPLEHAAATSHPSFPSRRAFLRNAALRIGSTLALPFVTHCAPQNTEGRSATSIPAAPNPTPTQTRRVQPTVIPTPTTPPPTVRSRLVRTQSASFWQNDTLSPDLLRQALDSAVSELSGIQDARQAWRSFFEPGERVAIKVNAISFGATNPALVSVVTQCLMDVGIPAENITLYDRTSDELKNAGFALNASGSGIRCRGNDGEYTEQKWSLLDQPVRLSRVLEACDALINMPVLKGFSIGGLSFALKNHYGSLENPSRFHDNRFAPGVTGLNALPLIREKTRLVIGDILSKETHADWTDYAVLGHVNTILVGADPLTVDTVGLNMALEGLSAKGLNTRAIEVQAKEWLAAGAALSLGASQMDWIDIKEIRL